MHEIVGRAAYLRAQVGYDRKDPPYSTTTLLDECFPDVVVTGADLDRGVTALSENRDGKRTIYYARNQPKRKIYISHAQQRTGIAHEIYHFLTDLKIGSGLRESSKIVREIGGWTAARDPIELACDLFAGEILVPFHLLHEYVPVNPFPKDPHEMDAMKNTIDRIASRFSVPVGFLRWRLYDLMKIRQSHYNPKR